MGTLASTEQAVVQFAISRGYLTAQQVEEALKKRSQVDPNGDLMPLLVPYVRPEHLPEMSKALQRARKATGSHLSAQATVAERSFAGGPSSADARGFADGRYQVVRELARGGMGVVYVAQDTELEREVALKQMLGEQVSGAEIDRFRREAKAAARLQHPNIVQVFDVGQQDGSWYMVMDLIKGESLQDRIQRVGRIPGREAAELGIKMAHGLGYAHQRQILHRDMKPHNVLVDETGEPKITDFGLAKVANLRRQASTEEPDPPQPPDGEPGKLVQSLPWEPESSLTMAGELLGTPSYMPPEQADGDAARVDGRADIYSLGATLYAMVTGEAPFLGASLLVVLNRVFEEPPRPPSELADVDPDLEGIILKCLEKRPIDRYPSCDELVEDLEAYLGDDTLELAEEGPNAGVLVVGALIGVLALLLVAGVALLGSDEPTQVAEESSGQVKNETTKTTKTDPPARPPPTDPPARPGKTPDPSAGTSSSSKTMDTRPDPPARPNPTKTRPPATTSTETKTPTKTLKPKRVRVVRDSGTDVSRPEPAGGMRLVRVDRFVAGSKWPDSLPTKGRFHRWRDDPNAICLVHRGGPSAPTPVWQLERGRVRVDRKVSWKLVAVAPGMILVRIARKKGKLVRLPRKTVRTLGGRRPLSVALSDRWIVVVIMGPDRRLLLRVEDIEGTKFGEGKITAHQSSLEEGKQLQLSVSRNLVSAWGKNGVQHMGGIFHIREGPGADRARRSRRHRAARQNKGSLSLVAVGGVLRPIFYENSHGYPLGFSHAASYGVFQRGRQLVFFRADQSLLLPTPAPPPVKSYRERPDAT